jgi:hypothetical protein
VSKLLGWIEWAEYPRNSLRSARGNLFVYEDCAVWSHPNKATSRENLLTGRKTKLLEQGYQEAELSPEELLGKHEKNWRVWKEEIERAWCGEYYASPNQWVQGAPVAGSYAADLCLDLIDGTKRDVHFRRVDKDDHAIWRRFEGWLGDRLERGLRPSDGGIKGMLGRKITGS